MDRLRCPLGVPMDNAVCVAVHKSNYFCSEEIVDSVDIEMP